MLPYDLTSYAPIKLEIGYLCYRGSRGNGVAVVVTGPTGDKGLSVGAASDVNGLSSSQMMSIRLS